MSNRNIKLGDINMERLLRDYRDAVADKRDHFSSDCMKNGEPPLEFVTKFCYYWLQYIESNTGLKLLNDNEHKEINKMIKTKEEMLEYLKDKRFELKTWAMVGATLESTQRYAQDLINSSSHRYKYDRGSIKNLDKYIELIKVTLTAMVRTASIVMATSVGLKTEEVDLSQITIEVDTAEEDSLMAKVVYPVWTKVFQDVSIVVGEAPNTDCLNMAEKIITECEDKSLLKMKEVNDLVQEAMTDPSEFMRPYMEEDDDDYESSVSVMTKGTPTIN